MKTVVLNAGRVNYDGKVDYTCLSDEVTIYEDTPEELLLERIAGQEIVVTKEMPLPGALIAQFPDSVRLIAEAGTGYNNIDLAAARARGILVCNVPAYSTQRVAHTAIAFILNLSSSLQKQQAMLTRGDHSNFTRFLQVEHTEVNGKTLGVIGAGHIGRAVIRIAQALDMEILAYDRFPGQGMEGVRFVSLEELLRQSDYVSLHCPLTPETHHLINRETLGLMKPTAFLVNTSRGPLVEEAALVEALRTGAIAGAALDVQEVEPPAEDSPLYTLENLLLTPHMGWKGLETRQRLVRLLTENIRAFEAGTPINLVG